MIIPLGVDDVQSDSQRAGRIRLENMYLIDSPFSPDGVARVSRPTLTSEVEIGAGPIYGMFRKEGTLGGVWFVVSGTELYSYDPDGDLTLLGQIPGTGFCEFSGGSERVLILRDNVCYSTEGTIITQVNMPDGLPVGSIVYIDNFFFLSIADSQLFYWIQPGGVDPDALDFASAERMPDNIVSVCVVGDELWFIGTESIEVWALSGDPDAPFNRVPGRAYMFGALNNHTLVNTSSKGYPCIIWVTDRRIVALGQGSPQRISNDSIDEVLRTATNLRAWSFEFNRHTFYVLTCDEATFAYDLEKGTWSRWSSYLKDNFRAHLGLQNDAQIYAGDYESNKIWKLEDGVADGDDPVIRSVSGLVLTSETFMPCSRVNVLMNAGWTNQYGASAVLEIRWSEDNGLTWSDYMSAPVGELGQYATTVSYSGLGMIRRPGRVFEFRFSDKSRFRLDYATMNEM